jgi:transcriptional regulator GlxA family with amidase domain
VIEAIETHLEDPLSREALAEIAGLSTRQLDRLFQAELGMTASSYCYAARLERAKMLLLQSDMTVLDIAVSCGFSSASHFSRSYRRHFGRPPAFDRKYRGRALAAERRLAAGSVGAE